MVLVTVCLVLFVVVECFNLVGLVLFMLIYACCLLIGCFCLFIEAVWRCLDWWLFWLGLCGLLMFVAY